MSRRGPEGKVQDAVIRHAKAEYECVCKKNEVGRYFVSSGFPDYTIFGRSRRHRPIVFFMEFKAPGGKLTPLQEHMKNILTDLGFNYYVVDSVEKGKEILRNMFT